MNNDWLDIAILEDYLDGKLDAKTMNRVEREALEDPFVAEALAGLSASPKRSLQSLSLLQKQLHERVAQQHSQKKASVFTWQRLSIAATAAVMFISISIMFWMRENNHQKELAGRPKKVDVNIAPQVSEEVPAVPPNPVVADALVNLKAKKEIDKAIQGAKTNAYALRTKPGLKAASPAKDSVVQLDDVVVVGFGTQRKYNMTASVSVVNSAEAHARLSGKVVAQDDGKPLPGVAVSVEGTNLNAVTDVNGVFKIDADTSFKEGKIRLNYIGFKTEELLAKANQPVNVSLAPAHLSLSEVVTVGYGTAKKEVKTDSAAPVSGVLAGRVAGVRIRGMATAPRKVQVVSAPVGGWDKLKAYIESNSIFSTDNKIGQTVELSFRITKDGTPGKIKVVKGATDRKYNDEAVRLIKNGPKWEIPENAGDKVTYKIEF